MKFFGPDMLHVTSVWPPSGLNVNSPTHVFGNGLKNSSLIFTNSPGRLSVMVILPSPTWLLPVHVYIAPTPEGAPSQVCFIAGSIFPHGFHAVQLWKSFTCANATPGGAAIAPLRKIRNSEGCSAMTT